MLSTKNNNNNSSVYANTIKCDYLEADNIYNKTYIDANYFDNQFIATNYIDSTQIEGIYARKINTYDKPHIDTLSGTVNTINSTVNNLTSKIKVDSNGVDILTGSLYFNGNKLFSEKVETTTNRINLSLYIDQF